MMAKMVDWLFGIFWRFDIEDETILLCLKLIQIYLKNKVVERSKL